MSKSYLKTDIDKIFSEQKITTCSIEEIAILTWLRWLMHKSEDYGSLNVSKEEIRKHGNTPEAMIEKLAVLTPFKAKDIRKGIYGLINKGIILVQGQKIISEEMRHQHKVSLKRMEAALKRSKTTQTGDNKDAQGKPQQKDLFGNDITDKPIKHIYGECKNVRLTDKEYKKLSDSYGEDGVKEIIQILDNYKEAKGVSYKSDYRAILNWVADRYKENLKRKEYQNGAQGRTDNGRTDYQQEEFQKHILDKLGM